MSSLLTLNSGRFRTAPMTMQDVGRRNANVLSLNDETPNTAWDVERLTSFAKQKLDQSSIANNQAILHAHKSAVDLFRAGCALFFLRSKCKQEAKGEWTKWLQSHGLAATTVNDAIRLYENAKTEDALASLGITEAKAKFVYPTKDTHDRSQSSKSDEKPPKRKKAAADFDEAGCDRRELNGDKQRSEQKPTRTIPPPKDPDTFLSRLSKIVRWLEYESKAMASMNWENESLEDCRQTIDEAAELLRTMKDRLPKESAHA